MEESRPFANENNGERILADEVKAWLLHPALFALALICAVAFILLESQRWLRCTVAHRAYHRHGVRFATHGPLRGYCPKCGRKWIEQV